MNKKLILCCDGTWNQPSYQANQHNPPTNVRKLMRAIEPEDNDGHNQVVYYLEGVGTTNAWDRFIGGITGKGISRNIQDGYRFLVTNYQPGDEIYLFGFSRGAYTARSLAAMLGCVGLIDKNDLEEVPRLYAYYRTQPTKRATSAHHDPLSRLVTRHVPIKFIGVWDTVGALGIPLPGLRTLSQKLWVGFHNMSLGYNVEQAYQALAIDEQRPPFAPDLWDRADLQAPQGALCGDDTPQIVPPTVLQVWFAGSHSNVGGGFLDPGLSDVTLEWMVDRSREAGIHFNAEFFQQQRHFHPQPAGQIQDSYNRFYQLLSKFIPPYERPLSPMRQVSEAGPGGLHEMLHQSVLTRMETQACQYAPANVLKIQDSLTLFKPRQTARHLQHQEARLNGEETFSCEVIDISSGGARLQCQDSHEVGEAISFQARDDVQHHGEVAWYHGNQIGIRFSQQATG